MGAADGVRAIAAEGVAAQRDQVAIEAEQQLGMFELPTRFTGEEADAQRERAKRSPGRPKGAQNKASRDLREFWRKAGFDPARFKLQWAQHTPESLAKDLNCTIAEAFDRLNALYSELMSYAYGKALPIDGDGNAVPYFLMQVGGNVAIAPGGTPGAAPWLADPRRAGLPAPSENSEQNQAPADAAEPVSHGEKSHGEPSD